MQIVFFCVKPQAKNDFPKDVEKTVDQSVRFDQLLAFRRMILRLS